MRNMKKQIKKLILKIRQDWEDRKIKQKIKIVYWLNYFGPGYVNFWGQDKTRALEGAYEVIRDENGGICVQTTDAPVFADDNIRKITDYEFKKAMYDILGHNTFIHETHRQGAAGQYVPTLEDHRRII